MANNNQQAEAEVTVTVNNDKNTSNNYSNKPNSFENYKANISSVANRFNSPSSSLSNNTPKKELAFGVGNNLNNNDLVDKNNSNQSLKQDNNSKTENLNTEKNSRASDIPGQKNFRDKNNDNEKKNNEFNPQNEKSNNNQLPSADNVKKDDDNDNKDANPNQKVKSNPELADKLNKESLVDKNKNAVANRLDSKDDAKESADENSSDSKDKVSPVEKGAELVEQAARVKRILSILSVIAPYAIPIFLLFLVVLLLIGVTTNTGSRFCNTTSNSDYAYASYGDEAEFVCKMQDPLVGSEYVVSTWGGVVDALHPYGHTGIDLATYGDSINGNIYAVQGGTVVAANGNCERTPSDDYDNYKSYCSDSIYGGSAGNYVLIEHGEIRTLYAHMLKGSVSVSVGDTVAKGQKIGQVGSTGHSTGEHLHFELHIMQDGGWTQIYSHNEYFKDKEGLKTSCGSSWDGEPAGDSANQANNSSNTYLYNNSSSSKNGLCCVGTGSYGTSNYCTDGINVIAGSNNSGHNADPDRYPIGIFSIDEYIPMVVSGENGGAGTEALKAQAIAARTYAINRTNNCKNPIRNSTEDQVAEKNVNSRVVEAVNQTSGIVMLYNGNLFSSEYDSFYNDSCYGATCSATYTIPTTKETHVLNLKSDYYNLVSGGHGRGMSQVYSIQMEDEGYTTEEMLRFFYGNDIEITGSIGDTCVLPGGSFDGEIWRFYQYNYSNPYGVYGTIATHGCGPTSMAVVVSSLLQEEHDPIELTNYACNNNYCSENGTYDDFFEAAAKKYGLKVKKVQKSNPDEVLIALNRGDSLVISIMHAGTFTEGGHFIVLTSANGDEVSVHDPASENNSKKTFSFENIILPENDRTFWIFQR